MPYLGVNVDHVATLRQARREEDPDPALAAHICESAGAHSIVAHLREDRRHMQDRDILVLRKTIKTRFNLEMSLARDIVAFAQEVKPDMATLVPERRQEITTEGGLDVAGQARRLGQVNQRLQKLGIQVSVFIAPDRKQIKTSAQLGIRIIELHTGVYSKAYAIRRGQDELRKIKDMCAYAKDLGLTVNAGHGLNYENVAPIAKIRGLHELNIGHSIITRALFVGLSRAVAEMVDLVR